MEVEMKEKVIFVCTNSKGLFSKTVIVKYETEKLKREKKKLLFAFLAIPFLNAR
jgi:hypothetical protein